MFEMNRKFDFTLRDFRAACTPNNESESLDLHTVRHVKRWSVSFLITCPNRELLMYFWVLGLKPRTNLEQLSMVPDSHPVEYLAVAQGQDAVDRACIWMLWFFSVVSSRPGCLVFGSSGYEFVVSPAVLWGSVSQFRDDSAVLPVGAFACAVSQNDQHSATGWSSGRSLCASASQSGCSSDANYVGGSIRCTLLRRSTPPSSLQAASGVSLLALAPLDKFRRCNTTRWCTACSCAPSSYVSSSASKDAPASKAPAAAAQPHLDSKQKVGFVQAIDGTVATIAPSSSKVSVAFNTVLEINVGDKGVANAVVFNLEKDGSVGVILLDNIANVRSGQDVFGTNNLLKIPVGFSMLGKIINPLGHNIPTGLITRSTPLLDTAAGEKLGLVEEMAPNIVSRAPVNYNLLTGFKVCKYDT